MKILQNLAAVIVFMQSSSAFIVAPHGIAAFATCTITRGEPLQMGLFDFFSEDARKEREERKLRETEEQERLQREIIARRRNPEKMEEYEAKVRVRRALRMAGEDEAAENVAMYDDEDVKIQGLN